jgi:outer membrane protein assembly factor BamB
MTQQKPLRLWPGIVAAVMLWLMWYLLPIVVPSTAAGYGAALGALVFSLVILVWWAFLSRAPRIERFGAIGLIVVVLAIAPRLLHESISTAGQGMMFFFYAIPVACLALVVWAVAARNLPQGPRRATLVATILVSCLGWGLLRTSGVHATGAHFGWRWSKTPEERLLAEAGEARTTSGPAHAGLEAEAEWPGFRGRERNGVAQGVRIATDWSASPPEELWRQPVGPGWSSFAVHGDLVYTQEQRGEEEMVSCYRATTGETVWRHGDEARFWESNAGAGPRATPTLSGGRVYAFGATGLLNALDAGDGSLFWSRDVAADTGVEIPYWGFSSSPLVIDDLVIVAAAGKLAAYDLESGTPRWTGPDGGSGYSSPHLATIDGVGQVLLLSAKGAIGLAPADGTLLWEHEWKGSRIVQPALTPDGDLLVGSDPVGTRRLAIANASGSWALEERWTSTGLKPYFSDFVVHDGHAIGFDGPILSSIDLANGERKWKGGRYGNGQLVLLPDQGVLLVVTEKGQLALVSATSERFQELARIPALEGKTWNHPVVVDDLLLVRNGQEMVAFRLPAG